MSAFGAFAFKIQKKDWGDYARETEVRTRLDRKLVQATKLVKLNWQIQYVQPRRPYCQNTSIFFEVSFSRSAHRTLFLPLHNKRHRTSRGKSNDGQASAIDYNIQHNRKNGTWTPAPALATTLQTQQNWPRDFDRAFFPIGVFMCDCTITVPSTLPLDRPG